MFNLSSPDFKAIKYFLVAKSDVSTPSGWPNYFLVA